MENQKKLVRDLNVVLTCRLCEGYFIDATALVDCLHTFCRGCILRYFESNKTQCPVCPTVYKKKSPCFRSDTQMQALVYKIVPSLCAKENQRREEFYRSTGVRAGSSCSDDSVIDRERDMLNETDEMISQYVGDRNQYFSAEDLISLSIEYYQSHLDNSDVESKTKPVFGELMVQKTDVKSDDNVSTSVRNEDNGCTTKDAGLDDNEQSNVNSNGQITNDVIGDKRYLQCPAGVNMKHLQKFMRKKHGLTDDHRVDIIYKGEVLQNDLSLMDVAYIFKWEKKKPMRFFYRIFIPMKVKPIKIINTTLSSGDKQLQIVPVTTTITQPITETVSIETQSQVKVETQQEQASPAYPHRETESEQEDKERLLANLQLQSKSKALQDAEAKKAQAADKALRECVFEYEEPDKEEIKRFAEKRDQEWALQKKMEEESRQESENYAKDYYTSKKRKKSKHSKSESNGHKEKKRKVHMDKFHAEITNNDKTDLKLKVKITTNGHKHKHHKIESSNDKSQASKERLLQMRQVRHKNVSGSSGDERPQPTVPAIKIPKIYSTETRDIPSESVMYTINEPEPKKKKESPKTSNAPKGQKTGENNNNRESQAKPRIEPMIIKPVPNTSDVTNARQTLTISRPTPRPETLPPKVVKKDSISKTFSVQTDKAQMQKTVVKPAPTESNKHAKEHKFGPSKMEITKPTATTAVSSNNVLPIGSISTNDRNLDRQIASLQERCTIETKSPGTVRTDNGKIDKKPFSSDKSKMLSPKYPPSFTVKKLEGGIKRKAEENDVSDKRPSLEITLITPTTTASPAKPPESKPISKRPIPGTIPLEKIKNLKSGVSIIPKMPERHDSIGVLDLSKSNRSPDQSPRASPKTEPMNGLNRQIPISRPSSSPGLGTPETKNMALSNLQMLSKVATEQSTINKVISTVSKSRSQLPNLQTIGKMQHPTTGLKTPGLQRLPPKLNEIPKFRPTNAQIRNMRPNPNQSIRNIPNPSFLINRQQQINSRLSANVTSTSNPTEKKEESLKSSTPTVQNPNLVNPVP
ncbi:hypothetical protein GWI33_021757, partial [Rhynchophorus ferrugineus]